MIRFVNAKINIGLQIVRRREDGYHDLQTVFYPVGKYAGMASDPTTFCDILELSLRENGIDGKNSNLLPHIVLSGRKVNCPLEKNLVYKAAAMIMDSTEADMSGLTLRLEKHLPDGAGLGGGSADAAFTLRLLAEYLEEKGICERAISEEGLLEIALKLGADCPFFIKNRPSYAEGVGESLEDINLDLSGYSLAVVKPDVYVSTKEAFAGIVPKESSFDLRKLPEIPIERWPELVKNDFEESIFPSFPKIADVKRRLYESGAIYASMSGSGSSVYGIFREKETALEAVKDFKGDATIEGSYLLKL